MRALSYLEEIQNTRYRDEAWKPIELHPDALSTKRYDDVARLLRGREGGRLLEIGCGSGRLMVALAGAFDELVGIDLSPPRIDLARDVVAERYPDLAPRMSFIAASGEDALPFEDASFDVVVACAVVEHVVDVFAVMDEMARVCRPGGHLVMTVPNIAYVRHVRDLILGRLPRTSTGARDIARYRTHGWDGGHFHYFTKGTLADLLVHVGFTPEAWTGDGRLARLRRWYINFVGAMTVRARRNGKRQ